MTPDDYSAHLPRLNHYLTGLQAMLARLPLRDIQRLIDLLIAANAEGRTVFILGNGGSAATASHLACDLAKNTIAPDVPRFRVVALTDNVPLITAWANDTAYENVFAEQLDALVRPGDVVIGISGSGNSENVLRAIRLANERGATTVGLTGYDGGRLKGMVALSVHVPHPNMEQVEDAHLILEHMICTTLRAELRDHAAGQTEEWLDRPEQIDLAESAIVEPVH
ncbi:MAG: SIS domain-containing protein [Chloroflexota bacterium]